MAKEKELDVAAHNLEAIAAEKVSVQAQADHVAKLAAAEAQAKADAEAKQAALATASRKARYAALIEQFKKERPLAYEARKHTGEFDLDRIPADFV